MHRRLIIILALLVLAPLLLISGLGYRTIRDEREVLRHQFRELLLQRLADTDARIATELALRRRQVAAATELPSFDPDTLRRRARETPSIKQIFVRGADGKLVFPSPQGPATRDEREFLLRTRQLWLNQDLFSRPPEQTVAPRRSLAQKQGSRPVQQAVSVAAPGAQEGWYVWFWQSDLGLLYWRRDNGRVIGAELDRLRLLADIIAALPSTDPDSPANSRITLLDARGKLLYQWGRYEPGEQEAPAAERTLRAPLSAWRLQYFAPPSALAETLGGGALAGLVGLLLAVGLGLVGLATYFYRESSREIRDASQRVSFVNQVSHELKTPLTNIRMYAELLARDFDHDDQDPRVARRLDIIVSESQRLSRLIGNVLTFARQRRDAMVLRPVTASLDEVVEEILEQFAPAFEQKGIQVIRELGAGSAVRLDRDVVGQIVANLLSNVEKYAGTGEVRITTLPGELDDLARLVVHDDGPGIPMSQAAKAFAPFARLDNRLSEGAAGTGIGLGLARDLARLHGGDLVLCPSPRGAKLELTINAPLVREVDDEGTGR